jgi:ubiquinone/menaquinone biosynthesis C-methylase UbiE
MGLVDFDHDELFAAAVPNLSVLGALGTAADLLVEAVRSGRARLECDVPAGASQVYPDAVIYLASLMSHAAEVVAERLRGADRILDVGAGAAPWSLAFARRDPRCRVTALDFASILASTRRVTAEAGCADQFEYVAGDAFEVSLRPRHLTSSCSAICATYSMAPNRRLLRRLQPAIQPGGRIAVIDLLPSHDPAVNRSVQLYAAGLMTRTSNGGVHAEESYRAWLEEAGFRDIRVHEASRTPPTLVVTGLA